MKFKVQFVNGWLHINYGKNGVGFALTDKQAKMVVAEIEHNLTPALVDGACAHEWLASTRDDVLCVCSKCGAETPRH